MHRRSDAPLAPAPDGAALQAWLASADAVRPDGAVLSWANPGHPGYPYPEAAALWLARAAWRAGRDDAPAAVQVRAVRDRLASDLRAGPGAGRDGRAYLFDTVLAIHALAWIRQSFPGLPPNDDADPAAHRTAVQRFLAADTPVLELGDSHHYSSPNQPFSLTSGATTRNRCVPTGYAGNNGDCPRIPRIPRWSGRWAPHLVRAAAFLARTAERTGDGAWSALAGEVRRRALREAPDGYVHARAYAAEGEALWRALGGDPGDGDPAAEADALAGLQRPDGGLPAFSDGTGPSRADGTAQAVRLWALVDPTRHRAAMDRALAFLAGLQAPSGGIAYEPGSDDVNTWASVFADQACTWALDRAEPRDLL